MIRPLLPEDVAAAQQVQWAALTELDARLGETTPELTPALVERGRARIAHLQGTDPGGAFVAEVDGEVVGCALGLVREGMWFLSLLMVDPAHQGRGVGRALLDATLATSTDRSWILATADPAALRRYRRAGFDLHASYAARGPVDRSLLPAVAGVEEPGFAAAADLVDHVSRTVRGASLAPELAVMETGGARLLTVPGRGYLLLRGDALMALAATDDAAARDLLWTALAEAGETTEVYWLAANQQWAIDVCLDARLTLGPGGTVCLRGQPPMSPYLPSGAFG